VPLAVNVTVTDDPEQKEVVETEQVISLATISLFGLSVLLPELVVAFSKSTLHSKVNVRSSFNFIM